MSRRVNIKAILRNERRREQLFVGVIIATQAREGITTTEAEARRAYQKVREEKR